VERWQLLPLAPEAHLARFPHLSPLLVQLLYNRGITAPAEVEAFLAGEFEEDNPFRLKGMREAVTRIRKAIRAGEPIVVYGDFDADGVTATALLVQTLASLGAAKVEPYIPNRIEEGYGLNCDALRRLASQGAKLIVTVDCGIRSIEEVSYGNRLGLDIIITDHHSVPERLPPALAIINPKQADCPYLFRELAGVGVAFKLAQALLCVNRQVPLANDIQPVSEDDLLDLVALGTVADMVPLLGENRALVRRGLEKLNQALTGQAQRLGVRALMAQAGVKPGEVDAYTIGYILAPRLNAAGRMDDAMVSYRLLTSESEGLASELAGELEERNQERQRLMMESLQKARERVLDSVAEAKLLFTAGEDYFSGVAGLVAGRLSEEFYRPTLVIELGEEESRGSARSIPEFDITAALDECGDLLTRYGGHAMAAGFTLPNANLDAFRERLLQIAERQLGQVELVATLSIDAEVALSDLGWNTQATLVQLEPFGYANPTPTLLSRGVLVRDHRLVGDDHLKLALTDGQAACHAMVWDAIAFHQGHWAKAMPRRIDIVYTLEVNEWQGEKRLQLNIKDLRPSVSAD